MFRYCKRIGTVFPFVGPSHLVTVLAGFWSLNLQGITWQIDGTLGLMQQPTSHYYLGVAGLELEGASQNGRFLIRTDGFARPTYTTGSFVEQEYGYRLLIGHRILQTRYQAVSAYGGIGRMFGELSNNEQLSQNAKRSYAMTGPSFSAKYELRYLSSSIALSHTTIIGYRDTDQLRAYVAWPFNFYTFHLGWRL